ncbi:MAG: TIGR04290 family methyltransferase [Acidobacteria bacterium]|nr:MAG: TIGR04290 family methyltransferase [Acidobacteriota bacterium]
MALPNTLAQRSNPNSHLLSERLMSSTADPLAGKPALAPIGAESDGRSLAQRIAELGEWFHNLDLHGVHTAPRHFLGDFPNIKWQPIGKAIPQDLTGATVLDIGCNGGFYSIQMKQRGARRVLGIDVDDRYLNQARFAANTLGLDIEFKKCSVYSADEISGQFDYVLLMGVFYHLRYPLFALDKVIKKVAGKLVFQTMIRGSEEARIWEDDYPFWNKEIFRDPDFPAVYFIEKSYSHDYTNWWIPNRAAVEAMLRSSGLEILERPESETWICEPRRSTQRGRYILDLELEGTL